MGMGMKSLKWEGIGTNNLFPHTSTVMDLIVVFCIVGYLVFINIACAVFFCVATEFSR